MTSPKTRIYVGGLEAGVTAESLEEEFSKFGKLERTPWLAQNGAFGFVVYEEEDAAKKAVDEMNGISALGSAKLRVEHSRPKPSYRQGGGMGGGGSSYRGGGGGGGGRGYNSYGGADEGGEREHRSYGGGDRDGRSSGNQFYDAPSRQHYDRGEGGRSYSDRSSGGQRSGGYRQSGEGGSYRQSSGEGGGSSGYRQSGEGGSYRQSGGTGGYRGSSGGDGGYRSREDARPRERD